MVLTMGEFVVVLLIPTVWAIIATIMLADRKSYTARVEEANNFEVGAHNMTKLALQAEQQRHAVTKDKLAHAEKMLYGTERLRKDVMA